MRPSGLSALENYSFKRQKSETAQQKSRRLSPPAHILFCVKSYQKPRSCQHHRKLCSLRSNRLRRRAAISSALNFISRHGCAKNAGMPKKAFFTPVVSTCKFCIKPGLLSALSRPHLKASDLKARLQSRHAFAVTMNDGLILKASAQMSITDLFYRS